MSLLEDVFATAYAADLGESPDGVHARVMATIALRGIYEVWDAWYEQHGSDPEFDPTEALALKADYLEVALAVGLDVVAVLPHPDRVDGARGEPAESPASVGGHLSRWRR
jgi:hypothetical protein